VVYVKLKRVKSKEAALLTGVFLIEAVRMLGLCNSGVVRSFAPVKRATTFVLIISRADLNHGVTH
jgi:hypothetical protein